MSPTGAVNSDSTPHSARSTPRPRHQTAGDSMALPELDVARVQRWCAARVPEHARHQVRVECEVAPRHLTIVERRAPWREDFGPEWTAFPIARLRYTAADKSWTLYSRDRNLRFHLYEPMAPSHRVEDPRHQTAHLPPLRWGQLQPSRRGQFRLTSPSCPAHAFTAVLMLCCQCMADPTDPGRPFCTYSESLRRDRGGRDRRQRRSAKVEFAAI